MKKALFLFFLFGYIGEGIFPRDLSKKPLLPYPREGRRENLTPKQKKAFKEVYIPLLHATGEETISAIRRCAYDKLYACSRELIKLLRDDEKEIRIEAAKALGLLGFTSSIDAIEKASQEEKDPDVLFFYLWGLAKLGGERIYPIGERFLNHEDPNLRRIAAQVLKSSQKKEATSLLEKRLQEEKEDRVKVALLDALLFYEPTSFKYRQEVIKLLESPNPFTRLDAAYTIIEHRIFEARKPLEKALIYENEAFVREVLYRAYRLTESF